MQIVKYFILFTLILIGSSCSDINNSSNDDIDLTADWDTLNTSTYSITYPANWTLDQHGLMGTSFVIRAPLDKDDNFSENVNLIIQNLEGSDIDLEKFVIISEQQIQSQSMMANSKLLYSERISKPSGELHKIIYTGDQNNRHLKFEALAWVIESKAYVLTYTSETPAFDQYQATAEKILYSFTLK